ncbi:hypothetical protein [Glaciihabitans sp. UYNi722]|uniref:hypothetical protein n=1 Tax=Glaciihabitans sp. UYNi722 TaxID=3156344 RepID=UPI0033949D1F
MSTIYIPETGTVHVPEIVKERTISGVLNRPATGTHIRATLGETVIVGRVSKEKSPYALIVIEADQLPTSPSWVSHLTRYSLWVDSGWTFEILDDAPVTE